jgi:cell wall-associated NlpC family hydrolase
VPQPLRIRSLTLAVAALAVLPAAAYATTGGAAPGGGAPVSASRPVQAGTSVGSPGVRRARARMVGGASARLRAPVPHGSATLLADGTVSPPAGAPAEVAAVIAAGNRIAALPYSWGGGHRTWEDRGYDCSGSVGYALHGGGLLDTTTDSSGLMRYGLPGPGAWITIYANHAHVFMVVAGLRFDTSGASPSRWQSTPRPATGYVVRHPAGF